MSLPRPSDHEPCPMGCGRTTDDVAGGPCSACWDEAPEPRCSWCGGVGDCTDGADPLDTCPDEAHACHACGGSGKAKDQVIF